MSTVERKKHIDMSRYARQASAATVEEAAAKVQGQAQTNAPVDSGSLSSSITRTKIDTYTWEVGPTVDYGVYVEFGTGDQGAGTGRTWTYYSDRLQRFVTTSGMAAQPYLRPALDSIRNRLNRIWRVVGRRFARR